MKREAVSWESYRATAKKEYISDIVKSKSQTSLNKQGMEETTRCHHTRFFHQPEV